jgi:hypothetical protein
MCVYMYSWDFSSLFQTISLFFIFTKNQTLFKAQKLKFNIETLKYSLTNNNLLLFL